MSNLWALSIVDFLVGSAITLYKLIHSTLHQAFPNRLRLSAGALDAISADHNLRLKAGANRDLPSFIHQVLSDEHEDWPMPGHIIIPQLPLLGGKDSVEVWLRFSQKATISSASSPQATRLCSMAKDQTLLAR
jgi:hypothetical protein